MNHINIIIGNICSLLAMGADSLSSTQRNAKKVLWIQSLGQLFYCIGAIILRGYSGAVQNMVSIVRNLVAIRNIRHKSLELALVIIGVVLGLLFNNIGLAGLLPVIANLQYTLAVFYFKDNTYFLKIAFLINAVLYIFFNWAIFNYVGVCTNTVVAITTTIFLIKQRPGKSE